MACWFAAGHDSEQFTGILVLVPRNMTQTAGFYNTMLQSDEPALIIETLNGYRLKERLPANVAEFCVPVGMPEILREGSDITIVTYGSMCRIVMDAAQQLAETAVYPAKLSMYKPYCLLIYTM